MNRLLVMDPMIDGDHSNDEWSRDWYKCQSLGPKLIVSSEWIVGEGSNDRWRLFQWSRDW